jgi:hypothetical protein
MMTSAMGYREAAPLYLAAGWRGVLGIPYAVKDKPPIGYTGYEGVDPSPEQIESWRRENGNVILRMPENVVGIDVDDYEKGGKRKTGAATLAKLESGWGRLPATWCATARDDEISGKYFFQVPPGTRLHDPGRDCGIEIIQHHHRFALVWPSYNPDANATVIWWDPEGYLAERVPRVDELPLLPEAWLEGLSRRPPSLHRGASGPVWDTATSGTPMLRLLEYIGLTDLRPSGKDAYAACPNPNHYEKVHDNFSVNIHHGGFKCWSCLYQGSLHRLIIDRTGLGLMDVAQLIRAYGVELTYTNRAPAEPLEEDDPEQVDGYVDDDGYEDPPERALQHRGITAEDADYFGIRWWDERDAWVIPVHDPVGRLVGHQFKSADGVWCAKGTPLSRNLFNLHRRLLGGQVIVVESPLDCATVYHWGYFALATYGVPVMPAQQRLLEDLADWDLVLALDNDEAGVAATRELLSSALRHRARLTRFVYDGLLGKDPGEVSEAQFRRGLKRAQANWAERV